VKSLFPLRAILVAGGSLLGSVWLRGEPAAPGNLEKPYSVFMGCDFSVEYNKEYYRVHDVSDGRFLIYTKGQPIFVSIKGPKLVGLRVEPSLKLAEHSATVASLVGERAYTPENDPQRKFLREQPGNSAAALADAAGAANRNAAFKLRETQSNPHASALEKGLAQRDAQMADNADTYSRMRSDATNPGYYAGKMQGELAKDLFDAISVTFEVSAEQPLNHPYVAVVTEFSEPGAKAKEVRNWIYAKELNPIEAKPTRIKILQGGLPPGFTLVNYSVHLFNNGTEVATNVSSKRVPLTREEAFDFTVLGYVSSHKGATLAPAPTMLKLPPDLRERVRAGQYADPLFVVVAKSGRPLEAFLDEAHSHKVDDPYLSAIVKDLRFTPALASGLPVESTAEVHLNKLLAL